MRPGLENRVNISGAFGVVVTVWALWMLLVIGASRATPVAPRRVLTLGAAAVALVMLVGYGRLAVSDGGDWAESADLQAVTLGALAEMPRPPKGSTVYAIGVAAVTAPRVSVFADVWELNGAARVVWRDGSLRAYPVFDGARLTCAAAGVVPTALPGPHGALKDADLDPGEPYVEPFWGHDHGAPYGRVVLVDILARRSVVLDSIGACRREVPVYLRRSAPFMS